MARFAAPLLLALLLAACSGEGWYGEESAPPLPGERISVLLLERELTADPNLAGLPVRLPRPQANRDWPQSGGLPTHAMQHLAAADALQLAWSAGVGAGSAGSSQLLAEPLVADGRVYAMDAAGSVAAFNAESGVELWRFAPDEAGLEDAIIGGGLAFADGRVIATLSSGTVVGLDARNGLELWRQALTVPLRAAPTVADGVVLVVTADNQLYALAADSGQPIWRHAGLFESAGVLGGPSPAVDGGIAVVPYSSAEVFALRVDNGRPLWNDTLQRPRRTEALAQINDIDGDPVIDGDHVYVGGYGGQLAAIDIRHGIRSWDIDLTTTQTPWVAGDFLYALTDRGEIVCIQRESGRIRWVSPLRPPAGNGSTSTAVASWSGPVLVGDRLLLANSDGEAIAMSPYNGEILGRLELTGPVMTPPVVADRTVYFLTENAELLAYR
jgi:outer membrane protein assembly factor BamB